MRKNNIHEFQGDKQNDYCCFKRKPAKCLMGSVLHREENIDLYYFMTSNNLVTYFKHDSPAQNQKKIELATQIKRTLE